MDNSEFILFERFYTVTFELAGNDEAVGKFSYSSLWVWLDRFLSDIEEVAGREVDEKEDCITLDPKQLIRLNSMFAGLSKDDLEAPSHNPASTKPISSHLFSLFTAAVMSPVRDGLDDKRIRLKFEYDHCDEIRIDEEHALSGGFIYE